MEENSLENKELEDEDPMLVICKDTTDLPRTDQQPFIRRDTRTIQTRQKRISQGG